MRTAEVLTADDAVADLIEQAQERGYLLLSELREHHDPDIQGEDWLDHAATAARDLGLPVVDDVTSEDEPPGYVPGHITTDSVRQYLNEAGRHELLTKEDEANLSKRYHAGLAAGELLEDDDRQLTPRQRARLQRVQRDGARAKDHMIKANLRLVVPQAKKYAGRDLDMIELIQEGNLGLLRAVEKFDYKKGYKFSTYAVWWIRQALQRGVASKGRTIRVPAHVWELAGKIRSTEQFLRRQLERDPTEEELAEAVDLSPGRVREVRDALQDLVSLDKPVGEDGDATMGDLLPDEGASDPSVTASEEDARSRIEEALSILDEREQRIIRMRFGLDGQPPRTLEEVGREFDLTRERIRQMQNRALAKLRHPSRAQQLSGLLDAIAEAA